VARLDVAKQLVDLDAISASFVACLSSPIVQMTVTAQPA
jgi:hypothetical protein